MTVSQNAKRCGDHGLFHHEDLLRRHAAPSASPQAGFITDVIGVRHRTSTVWPAARIYDGQKLGLPIPDDFHAEAIEWVGMLKAVEAAGPGFTMLELGAGYGMWSVASGVAARNQGLAPIKLYAVEGDAAHCALMRTHFCDNGFGLDERVLLNAAVGVRSGMDRWPVPKHDHEFGGRPLGENTIDYTGRAVVQTRDVRLIALADILDYEPFWDFLHCDIQGGEFDVLSSCVQLLNERVHWMVIGTHSRKLDGDLIDMLWRAGWNLEDEQPTRFTFRYLGHSLEEMNAVDGTQIWRNPRLDR
jgi:FkbM family methyltransferase